MPLTLSLLLKVDAAIGMECGCVGRMKLAARIPFVIEIVPFEPGPSAVFPVQVVDGVDEPTDLVATGAI